MSWPAFLIVGILCAHGGRPPADLRSGQEKFFEASLQASAYRSRGEFEAAAAALQEALSISERYGLEHHHRLGLVRMGLLLWDLARMPESSRYFGGAMAAFERAGDLRAARFCRDCVEIVRLYEEGKKDREGQLYYVSLEKFDRAISLGRSTAFPDFELKCLRQKSLTCWEMGRVDAFLEMNRRALGISAVIRHDVERGRCLNNIGLAYHKQNEYSLALTYLEDALSCIRRAGDTPSEAECLNNLGILYRDLGHYPRAQHYLAGALAIDREIGDRRSVAADLGNIGTVFLKTGVESRNAQDFRRGLDAFREMLSSPGSAVEAPRSRIMALNNMGIILDELGQHQRSRTYFEESLRAADAKTFPLERGHLLGNIAASFLHENRVEEARRYYEKSYEWGVGNALENVVIEASFGLGECYELERSYPAALEFYQRSMAALEDVQGRLPSEILTIGFERSRSDAHRRVIDLLAREYEDRPSQELLGRIFDAAERARARAFLENIRHADQDGAAGDSPQIQERLRALAGNIRELAGRLARPDLPEGERAHINIELEHEEDESVRLSLEAKAYRQGGRDRAWRAVRSVQEIQSQVLDDRTALLEYILGEERSSLLLLTSSSAELFALPRRTELERSLRAYLKLTSDRSAGRRDSYGAAERIARELLPFLGQNDLNGATKLIIVPDGILHYLPFETLRCVGPGGPRYVAEIWALSYCPSASSLWALRNQHRPRVHEKDLLAVGEPLYARGRDRRAETAFTGPSGDRGSDLSPLPYSREEVREIARLFPKGKSQVLVGEAASEDAVKALPLESYKVIHMACHGVLDESRPFRSALVLSLIEGQKNDGFLQMREIYGLTTDADLVVLSACQSARGLLGPAEGLMGLARPFFFTGARSVLASLWTVNDRAAVLLMREFYRQFLSGKTAGESLRLAKIKLLETSGHPPFFWAGFVLLGDPDVKADER